MGYDCRIACVIPTYNRRNEVECCLRALLGQTRPLDRIFVVDNASVDGTQEMVRERFPHNVTLIRLEENTGSAGGFYEGLRAAYLAGYDWIWAMDNDAEPAPNALEELVKSPGFADPRVGLLGSLVVGPAGEIQYGHSARFSVLMRQIPVEDEHSTSPLSIDAKSYTGALIHRRAIDRVGFPRTDFFAFHDDLQYTYRISRKLKLFLVPTSRLIHESEVIRCTSLEKSRWLLRSRRWPFEIRYRVYYTRRNQIYFHTRSAPLYAVPLLVAESLYGLFRNVIGIFLFDDQKRRRARVILRATSDGLWGRLGKAPQF